MIPPLGAEDGRVRELVRHGRVDVRAALHGQRAVDDDVSLQHADVRLAHPAREGGILQGGAEVVRYGWVESQGLVERVGQVLHVLEVLVGWGARGSDGVENLGPELVEDRRVVAELVDGPGEGRGGGVSAREEDGHDLVPDYLAVAGEAGDVVQEGKALVVLGELLQVVGGEGQGLLDVVVHELLDDADATLVSVLGSYELKWAIAKVLTGTTFLMRHQQNF